MATNGNGKRKAISRSMEPVGLAEIAERMNVSRYTVDKWRQRDLLPEPRWTVGGDPAWNWPDIHRWARDTDREWRLTGRR